MKIGKVSQTVLSRSLLKQINKRNEERLIPLSVEEVCAGLEVSEDEQVIFTQSSRYGDQKNIGVFAMAEAVNNLAAKGAVPTGIMLTIMLPPHAYESRLKAMAEHMEQAAETHGISILGARAEVNPAVTKAVVYVTGIGKVKREELLKAGQAEAGQDIVLTKWMALEGTLRILGEKKEELSERFVPSFLQPVMALEEGIFALREMEAAKKCRVSAMHQVTDGGILAALWEAAEASDVGLEIDLKQISIKQETIEICEYYHLNPYQMTSAGCMLMFAEDGEALCDALREAGAQAAILGKTTSKRERVIVNGEEKRFIDRPAPDELIKMI